MIAAALFSNELLLSGTGFFATVLWRPAGRCTTQPCYFCRCGHLAQVAYGHPGSNAQGFINVLVREVGSSFSVAEVAS